MSVAPHDRLLPIYDWTKLRANTLTIEQGLDAMTALNKAYIEYLELAQQTD